MLVYRLELFFSLNVLSIWVSLPGHNSVPGNVTMFFNDNNGMLLRIMGVRFTSSFLYLDIVLSLVITLNSFCHKHGRLLHTRILFCGGYAFFQVHKILKWIYQTFGYGRGCALGRKWWTASALDVVHPEGKGKRQGVKRTLRALNDVNKTREPWLHANDQYTSANVG